MSDNVEVVLTKKFNVKLIDKKNFRKEASRLAAMANKRVKRLEKNGLTDSPAYKKLVNEEGVKFSIKGKTYNEVQHEVARMNKFINAETSTIRGINKTLKNMAINTGMNYKNVKDLHAKAKGFFELASKVEDYLRSVHDIASAIGYHKIWEVINEFVETENLALDDTEDVMEKMQKIVDKLVVDNTVVDEFGYDDTEWYLLK